MFHKLAQHYGLLPHVKESKVPVGIRTNSREQEVVAKVNHFGF
jgi:hypothetical protein